MTLLSLIVILLLAYFARQKCVTVINKGSNKNRQTIPIAQLQQSQFNKGSHTRTFYSGNITLHKKYSLSGPSSNASWIITSTDGEYTGIPGRVPGDLLTDLMNHKLIDDPYFDRNFLTQRHVWMGNTSSSLPASNLEQRTRIWEYTTSFVLPDLINNNATCTYVLVMEGIKMGATVSLNGDDLGNGENTTSQFLRYRFLLPKRSLKKGLLVHDNNNSNQQQQLYRHTLTITFDPAVRTDGRFMACSGGWDWAPYTKTGDERGSRVFTLGITDHVSVVEFQHVNIIDIVPRIYYQGPYPRTPMRTGSKGDFLVQLIVYLDFAESFSRETNYVLAIYLEFSKATPLMVPIKSNSSTVVLNFTAYKNDIELWWPRNMGAQPLYAIQITLAVAVKDSFLEIGPKLERRVGFRTLALVTTNDTDDAILNDMIQNHHEGSGNHGMYFRINGAVVWCRGANVIPMDQLEGRTTANDEGYRLMVQSAAMANMNMLRVWGGGTILPQSFYDTCDELGILIYHDLMFVEENNHGATQTPTIEKEIIHIIRKLSYHASIILWNGCNECTYFTKSMEVYESFVMKTVAEVDDTRPIWPSSPSAFGWAQGVHMLDGRPNGRPLKVRSENGSEIETHGPYQRGYSFSNPAVNGGPAANANETQIPPYFGAQYPVGTSFRNIFVSEFGASVFSSFESMSAMLSPSAWSVHGEAAPDSCMPFVGNENACNGTNVMAERNYPCDSRIKSFFGTVDLDTIGKESFQRQLYLCMISQMLWMKGIIEVMRSHNSYGTLIWQLNENWPTGGWGCIEYGSMRDMPGQVVGGRWKPLMYILQRLLFSDIIVACDGNDLCYARNDGVDPVDILITFEAWNFEETEALRDISWYPSLPSGRSVAYYTLPKDFKKGANVVLLQISESETNMLAAHAEAYLWLPPQTLFTSVSKLSVVISTEIRVSDDGMVTIEVSSNRLALYVVLSTLSSGHFSDNAFMLWPGLRKIVRFTPVPSDCLIDIEEFRRTLRVEHIGGTNNVKFGFSTKNSMV